MGESATPVTGLHLDAEMSSLYVHITGEGSDGMRAPHGGSVMGKAKKRQRGRRSYCQRLIDNLDGTTTKRKQKSGSGANILSVPMEIRQQILLATKEDSELLHADLRRDGADLSSVCRTFREDMAWVSEQWVSRSEELSRHQTSAFSNLIDDLMGAACIDRRRLLHAKPLESQRNAINSAAVPQNQQAEESSGTAPFAAMHKWRKQRLQEAAREGQARRMGSREWRELRRKALMEKETMKFDRLSFLPPEERGWEGRAGSTRKQAKAGERGTFVEGRQSARNRKNAERYEERKRSRAKTKRDSAKLAKRRKVNSANGGWGTLPRD